MSEAMFGVRRAWRNPALSLLQFVPVGVDQGLEVGPEAGHVIVAWEDQSGRGREGKERHEARSRRVLAETVASHLSS